jgi:MOB kinase activator 1
VVPLPLYNEEVIVSVSYIVFNVLVDISNIILIRFDIVLFVDSYHSGDKNKTFKPKKSFSKGTKRYELHKHAKATLGSGNLRQAVMLPEREDINEWLAVNSKISFRVTSANKSTTAVDFFNQINLLYGSITEFCTPKTCEVMSAGPK